jgi:hypothetical protein
MPPDAGGLQGPAHADADRLTAAARRRFAQLPAQPAAQRAENVRSPFWERSAGIRTASRTDAGKPCSASVCGLSPLPETRREIAFDHRNDHRQRNFQKTKNRITGCSAVGSAGGLGPSGRRFEPCHSDQKSSEIVDFRGFFYVKKFKFRMWSKQLFFGAWNGLFH